jgi:hypothetical protein
MKKFILLSVFLLVAGLCLAGQPVVTSCQVVPTVAAPGDTVAIIMEFDSDASMLKSIVVTVREYPYEAPKYHLKPTENKNIWTCKTVVPWDAPNQTFHLDIKALDNQDAEIVTAGYEYNSGGRSGMVEFKVE